MPFICKICNFIQIKFNKELPGMFTLFSTFDEYSHHSVQALSVLMLGISVTFSQALISLLNREIFNCALKPSKICFLFKLNR